MEQKPDVRRDIVDRVRPSISTKSTTTVPTQAGTDPALVLGFFLYKSDLSIAAGAQFIPNDCLSAGV
jgi:hypothetical protein